MNRWSFFNPVRTVFSYDIGEDIVSFADSIGVNINICIVTGKNSSKLNSSLTDVTKSLTNHNIYIFDKISPEPFHNEIMEGKEFVEKHKVNLVIGLGGGSPLDSAKAITCLANTNNDITAVMNREIPVPNRIIKMIAIPTTAGTGSEVTPYSVLTNEVTNVKKSIASPFYYFDLAILTPKYLRTVPQKTIADVGIDSLAHAFEALWSIHSQHISEALAFKAIKLIKENLNVYYNDSEDENAAKNMLFASNVAGLAFSNTFTAACHGLSFPIGARFKLTHGHSCGLTLPAIAEVNSKLMMEKFDALADYIDVKRGDIPSFINDIRNSVFKVNNFKTLNATQEDFAFIANNAFLPLMNNNPVNLSTNDIINILKNL